MLSTRWRKVVRELWSNRTRTLLVVASIAVGIFAVGTVQQLRTVVLTEMQSVYAESGAAHATVLTADVDEATVEAVRRTPGIADAQGRAGILIKVQVASGEWKNLSVTALDDFEDIRIDRLEPVYALDRRPEFGAAQTAWPAKDEIILERSSLDAAGALPPGLAVGDTLLVETRDGKQRTLRVSGAAFDPSGFPSTFTGTAAGYVTLDTFVRLGGSRTYDRVLLQMTGTAGATATMTYITAIAQTVSDKIENRRGIRCSA